ncbi:YokU family protein [Alkalihalophilus lindianensis]|uniref:YokU family protein n=1 Tax=Alkalihalophilus lindianensis TaxID=1630542 RepID=A0ABU3X6Z0_9BACI|nr:YokU family protein [Alkalihalophilus lindianensis]MDV2683663.1 YokU family protein [Alkalihalophilus lindianensis]
MQCQWCEEESARISQSTVYWELPDGTRAIEITETPTITCDICGMLYQEESLIDELEDHLMLINTKTLPKCMTYQALMAEPKLLKRNYFRF